MNDYQQYVILSWYNQIRQYEIKTRIKKLNSKYISKQIYIEILGYKCDDIKMNNNIRRMNEYYSKWLNIKTDIKFDMTNNI